MRWGICWGAVLFAVLGVNACKDEEACSGTQSRVCYCGGNEQGTHFCQPDNTWSTCECEGSNSNGGSANNPDPGQGVGAQYGDPPLGDAGQDPPASGGTPGAGGDPVVNTDATASVVNNHEGCSVYARLDGGERQEILPGEAFQFPTTVGAHSISITGGSLENGDPCELSGRYQCDMLLGDGDNASVTVSPHSLTSFATSCPQCAGSTGEGSGEAAISLVNDNRFCTVGIRIDGGEEQVVMPETAITLPVEPGSHSISIDSIGTSAEGECSLGHIGGPQCDVELAAGDHKSVTLTASSNTIYGVACWSCDSGGGDPGGGDPAPTCKVPGAQCTTGSQCCSGICGGSYPTTCG